jgi:hypothetical protein
MCCGTTGRQRRVILVHLQRFDWIADCTEVLLSDFEPAVVAVGSGTFYCHRPLYQNNRGGMCLEMIGERQLFKATDFV